MSEYLETYDQASSESISETGQQAVLAEESAKIEEAEKVHVLEESTEAVAEADLSPNGKTMLMKALAAEVPSAECPKEYVQSPFSYLSGCETVSLNNGSVQHSVTDFVLPGRNGFDLEMVRKYNAFDANTTDMTPAYIETLMYTYRIKVDNLRIKTKGGSTVSIPNGSIVDYNNTPMTRELAEEKAQRAVASAEDYHSYGSVADVDIFEVVSSPDVYKLSVSYPSATITREGSFYANYQPKDRTVLSTATRDNSHLRRTYGLGYGWGFALPSIEIVPEVQYGSTKVAIKEFLHLASGESFEIKNKNTLDKHTLTDVQIQSTATLTLTHPVTGGTVTYNRIVNYKNGNKDYFTDVLVNNALDSCKLVAQQDRFGNTITYSMADYGGMTIVDTTGKTVTLVKSGNTLIWNLPDNRKILYTTDGTALTQVNDEISRVTAYEYTSRSAVNRYNSEDYDGNPAGVPITFNYLAAINHPSGARTEYTYPTAPVTLTSGNYGGYTQYFPLSSRKDTYSGVTANKVDYAFTAAGKYISTATITRNSGAVVETHTFNSDNLCI